MKEYNNLIKISHRGKSVQDPDGIDPDSRDKYNEEYEIIQKNLAKAISNTFPGVETKNGPAIIEKCICTVNF